MKFLTTFVLSSVIFLALFSVAQAQEKPAEHIQLCQFALRENVGLSTARLCDDKNCAELDQENTQTILPTVANALSSLDLSALDWLYTMRFVPAADDSGECLLSIFAQESVETLLIGDTPYTLKNSSGLPSFSRCAIVVRDFAPERLLSDRPIEFFEFEQCRTINRLWAKHSNAAYESEIGRFLSAPSLYLDDPQVENASEEIITRTVDLSFSGTMRFLINIDTVQQTLEEFIAAQPVTTFLVFAFDAASPGGGESSFVGKFGSMHEAVAAAEAADTEHAQVYGVDDDMWYQVR